MKKRLLALVMISVLMLTVLTACKDQAKETEKPKEDSDQVVEESKEIEALDKTKVYVEADWLKSVIDGNQPESEDYVVLEASWGTESDSPDYKDGHVPGAIHVDTSSLEDEPLWNLRPAEEIENSLLEMGVTKDTTAILYSADPSAVARVAYAYLWLGVENVKILNGGMEAWKAAGYEIDKESNLGEKVEDFGIEVPAHPEYWTSLEEAKEKLENDSNFKLVSIRSYEEFIGNTSGYSYIPKGGEPKGAVWGKGGSSAFTMEDYTHEDGRVINMEEMKELWKDLDFDDSNELAFYCGTGWRAAIPFLIMYENGYTNMSMYDGGWFEWQMHDDLPVQVGDPKKDGVEYKNVGDLSDDKAAIY